VNDWSEDRCFFFGINLSNKKREIPSSLPPGCLIGFRYAAFFCSVARFSRHAAFEKDFGDFAERRRSQRDSEFRPVANESKMTGATGHLVS
jgi:hypothetical protein